ncbi:MAG: type II toxin-antitoxin system VapC family toxin [Paludibacter sp.]|jgi:predicted nucleic acid-binding protein|nr:type II toxin-antitoxin system VapC family toxin [Paludibacter sp.]
MEQYLIDNNVISNYFSGLFTEKAMRFVGKVIDQIPNISVITVIEALSWRSSDRKKEAIVKMFVDDANVLTLSPDIVSRCVAIRRSQKIKIPDAIIAATAIVHGFTLITSDSDFKNIQELKIVDPYSL